MDFKEWLNRKTLYHGTVIDNEPSIKKFGLVGGWHGPTGAFVDDAYGSEYTDDDGNQIEPEEEDQVVFATDKQQLGKAVGAMVFHIGRKLGKDFQAVSDNDIRNHGLLVAIKDSDLEPHDPDKWQDNVPRGAEPGDYYSREMGADSLIKGSALIRFLRNNGEWPREWGKDSGGRQNILKGRQGARDSEMWRKTPLGGAKPHLGVPGIHPSPNNSTKNFN